MTLALKLLIRVMRRRVESGEEANAVLADYPKLTEGERKAVQMLIRG